MDAPVDWHDLAMHHDFEADVQMRRAFIDRGVLLFPVATKQGSISAAHTEQMIDETLTLLGETITQSMGQSTGI